MSDNSAIEWTDATWNPVTGCDRVSPGCAHCYALDLAARLKAMGNPRYQRDGDPKSSGPGFGVTLHEDVLEKPLHWRKPRRVFVNSMSDLFHPAVPFEFVSRVFETMLQAEQHTFQILTKRPERMLEYFKDGADYQGVTLDELEPWPNIWLGTSIENRRFVDRADYLRATPAAVRFISAEPLLGPLVERVTHGRHCFCTSCASEDWTQPQLAPCGMHGPSCPRRYAPYRSLDLADIDWLIVGGESGPNHRPIDPRWVRGLRDAALATELEGCAGRAKFFFKQWGGRTPKAGGRELDGRTWDEFPQALEAATA